MMYDASASGFADESCDETRQCIRALVTVIRQAQGGSSPVDNGQLAHMRKVVRLLSLSEQQLAEMPPDEREAVVKIRCAARKERSRVDALPAPGSLYYITACALFTPARPLAGKARFRR